MNAEGAPRNEDARPGDAARFGRWNARQEPGLSAGEARAKAPAFTATMPAWKDHPTVREATS